MGNIEERNFCPEEQSIVVDLIIEAKNHMRHCQKQRATYLNFFLFLYTSVIAAFLAILSFQGASESLFANLIWGMSLFIWIVGVMTIIRSELWTAHILHNLFISRRLTNFLHTMNPSLRILRNKPTILNATNEFTRLPWSKEKSIDTILAIVLTQTSGVPFLIFPPFEKYFFGFIIGAFFILTPLIIWYRVSQSLSKSHKNCCYS